MIPRKAHITTTDQVVCPHNCPGCAHRNLDADQSNTQKTAWLKKRLAPWMEQFSEIRALPAEDQWGYRDKTCLSADWANGGWRIGLRRDQEIIPVFDCPVHTTRVQTALKIFAEILPDSDRFPLTYYAQSGAQVTLVLKTRTLPETGFIQRADVMAKLSACGVEGVWLHLHPSAGKRVFAKNDWHLAWGVPRSCDGDTCIYGPTTFQQATPLLYENALDAAETFLFPLPGDRIIDLYCGTGKTASRWTRLVAAAIGVELSAEAIDCARANAPAAEFLRGSCANRLPQLDDWLLRNDLGYGRRLLYVNPPRTGLEPIVCRWISDICRPEKMAYLSCSAGTLHRDLTQLTAAGFEVVRIIPYDFFPRTLHVETLVLLDGKASEACRL